MSRAASETSRLFPTLAAAAVVLEAIWCGGGTQPGPEALVLGAIGALLVLAPAKQWPVRGFAWLALVWLGLAATAFLPAAWFHTPAWRERVVAAGVVLPTTLSPQPWLTLDALIWLAAGLSWIGWLTAQAPAHATRRIIMRVLAAGLIVVATVALVAWKMHWRVPGWLSERGFGPFGPFPNRNHTGQVFALGGILALSCAADAARRQRWQAALWLAGALVIGAALVVNYSRGGILLFFGAAGLWAALEAWQRRSWKTIALGAAALLVAAAIVLLAGGPVAGRFAGGGDSQIAFRTLIWRDTLDLIHGSSWCGAGLGNFRALFPFFRNASVIQQAVWHPESDWLWLAVETSWLGVALAVAVLAVLVRGAFPLTRETQLRLRIPALAGAIGAALHALVDVPAPRPGSVLLALLLLALAREERRPAAVSPGASWLWRGLGLGLLAAATCWFKRDDDLARAEALVQVGQFPEAEAAATRAIARAPLKWEAWFTRASAAACQGHTLAALGDFRRARLLEPHYAGVPLEEGKFWARYRPALAMPPWRDALQRVSASEDQTIYRAMLGAAPDDAAFRQELLTLAAGRPGLQLLWFQSVPVTEAKPHIEEFAPLAEHASAAERAAFTRRAEAMVQATQ